MKWSNQFKELWGRRVLIEPRKEEDKKFVGTLTREDRFFVYLENVKIVTGGKVSEAPRLAIHKGKIGLIRELAQEGEEGGRL